MNRRRIFKAGMALVGGSVLSSVINAQGSKQENNKHNLQKQNAQDIPADTSRNRRKPGVTLEVSSIVEIKGERLPNMVLLFSDVEAPFKN